MRLRFNLANSLGFASDATTTEARFLFGEILTALLLQLQIQILWMVEFLGVCHHEVFLLKGFWDKTLIPNLGPGVSRPDLGVS